VIDRETVQTGAAASGAPWQYFDLGHGYCTYNFFEQCPHRMACARCDFYLPKASTRAQLVEAKASLHRMLLTIPLTDDERAAVDDGADAVERLLARLADTPTPAGPTPREIPLPPGPLHEIQALADPVGHAVRAWRSDACGRPGDALGSPHDHSLCTQSTAVSAAHLGLAGGGAVSGPGRGGHAARAGRQRLQPSSLLSTPPTRVTRSGVPARSARLRPVATAPSSSPTRPRGMPKPFST
jgi:hypothetical protein